MDYRSSYLKTIVMALALAAFCAISAMLLATSSWQGAVVHLLVICGYFAGVLALLIVAGGITCLWRDARERTGKPDLFAGSANRTPGRGWLSQVGLRFLLGPAPRPGDLVEIRPLAEIAATLDARNTLDGLPFMQEMHALSGGVFRVHRRVEKINDMRHKTGLRRLRNTVTLTALRCSGSHHGGCEAECQLLWKDAWLRRLPEKGHKEPAPPVQGVATPPAPPSRGDPDQKYVCQMTSLWEASTPMSRLDFRQDIRPLFSGNLGTGAYLIGLLTRVFNIVQRWRGGMGYPHMSAPTSAHGAANTELGLQAHDRVVVRGKHEIAPTLVNGRNRGLWFDPEMLRFCGQPDAVHKRVHRIIHEATGKMVEMKTPCVVLEKTIATGEFLRFCPQHEYIFWREAWLRRSTADVDQLATRE
jgi:hypothetical protein